MRRLGLALAALALTACSATIAPTPHPATAAPTVSSAAPGTPAPSPTLVDVYAGKVIFGNRIDLKRLRIALPVTSFKRTVPKIAWVAHFNEPAGASRISLLMIRISGATETVLSTTSYDTSTDALVAGSRSDLADIVKNRTGTYTMRLVRGSTVLAEGTFKLTD